MERVNPQNNKPKKSETVSAPPAALTLEERLGKIERVLEAQQSLLADVHKDAEKTRRYIFWGRMVSLLYLLIIILPILLAALYLPPYIRQATSLFGTGQTQQGDAPGSLQVLKELLQELKKGY